MRKRFLSILLTLLLVLSLAAPALAVNPGESFIRVLGTSGARTTGLRVTNSGGTEQYEFVYTDDGVNWISAGATEELPWNGWYDGICFWACRYDSTTPAWRSDDGSSWTYLGWNPDGVPSYRRGVAEVSGLRFELREEELWLTDRLDRSVQLTGDFADFRNSYTMADIQAWTVPEGIRVAVHGKYAYDGAAERTYSHRELTARLSGVAAVQDGAKLTLNGVDVALPIPLYQVNGCTMAPLRQLAEATGYTFAYSAADNTAVCERADSCLAFRAGSNRVTVDRWKTSEMAVPTQLRAGYLCVPLLYFASVAGVDVVGDGQNFALNVPALETGNVLDGPMGSGGGPVLCDTGRDYVLYYTSRSGVYRSSGGLSWTEIRRQWVENAAGYSTREFDLLWTGNEYMMRQNLQSGDPDTPDSPRNNWVTFLDEGFHIVGVKAFDGPVTGIRYEDGVYYASVDGTEHSFTRTDWDLQTNGRDCAVGNGFLVRSGTLSQEGVTYWDVSTDGQGWIRTDRTASGRQMALLETGGAVARYSVADGALSYWDGTEWAASQLGFAPTEGLTGEITVTYCMAWTGDGYLMGVQAADGSGGASPWNRRVIRLDEDFRRTADWDMGAPVLDVSCVDGVWYVSVDGTPGVYSSTDGESSWTPTRLAVPPEERPEVPKNACTMRSGDQTDGTLIYRMDDKSVLVSADGVNFRTLYRWGPDIPVVDIRVYAGADGTILMPLNKFGQPADRADHIFVDRVEQQALLEEIFGKNPTCVAVEGRFLESVDTPVVTSTLGCAMAPMQLLSEAFGGTFHYDADTGYATYTKDGHSVTVAAGSRYSEVTGRTNVYMHVPPEWHDGVLYVPVRFMVDAAGLRDELGHNSALYIFYPPVKG